MSDRTPNQYTWNVDNTLTSAAHVDPVATVLHFGFFALCEQIALLTDAIKASED